MAAGCNQTVAEELRDQIRVLCWVMTGPNNHYKAAAVKDTWGKHCDKLLFMVGDTSKADPRLPLVELKVPEGRTHLWDKTKEAFSYLQEEQLLDAADWVLKADDDTFVVMENLRRLVSELDPSRPYFLGLRFRPSSPRGFMSGGAGYVLSREAARHFVLRGLTGGCKPDDGHQGEDVSLGRCLSQLNVTFVDSRDAEDLERFHAYTPSRQMAPDEKMDWLQQYSYGKLQPASRCCSSEAISFHYVQPAEMRALYYLIYKLRPYGLHECS